MAISIRKFLREPLLQFLMLGAVMFLVYGLASKSVGDEPGQIVVTQGQIASLVEGFSLTMQRPPTRDELEGLIRDTVHQEVYYREALALGLDKGDIVIRRRLAQKLEFLSDDIAAQAQPTDVELGAFLTTHPDLFRVERQFTFSQVFLNPKKHDDHLAGDAAQLLSRLNQAGAAANIPGMGDPIMLDQTYNALPADEVAKLFGEEFATALNGISPGQWQGPVTSAFGVHMVLVTARSEGRVPALTEIRDAVQREWANSQRQETNDKLYKEMLKHYVVTVEAIPPVADPKKLAVAK